MHLGDWPPAQREVAGGCSAPSAGGDLEGTKEEDFTHLSHVFVRRDFFSRLVRRNCSPPTPPHPRSHRSKEVMMIRTQNPQVAPE